MADAPRVGRIWQEGDRTLAIAWTTGEISRYDVVELRRRCPCAHCVDEWDGTRRLDPAAVPDTLRPSLVRSVGRYALTIVFDDGHDTGIYPFELMYHWS